MKWKIIIEMEGKRPRPDDVHKAKDAAEQAVLEHACEYVRFINTTAERCEE